MTFMIKYSGNIYKNNSCIPDIRDVLVYPSKETTCGTGVAIGVTI